MHQDFDFNEWADLFRADPQAFEARRQAVIALELARNHEHAGPARHMLAQLEQRLSTCSEAERLPTSLRFMAQSLGQLQNQMDQLSSSFETFGTALAQRNRALAQQQSKPGERA